MKGRYRVKRKKSGTGLRRASFLICLLILLGTGFQPLAAGEQKDLILVLDTSLSMAGLCPGCRNIFAVVKKSLDGFVEKLEDGDSFTFTILIRFQDNEMKINYKGKATGDEIQLTATGGMGGQAIEWKGKRVQ